MQTKEIILCWYWVSKKMRKQIVTALKEYEKQLLFFTFLKVNVKRRINRAVMLGNLLLLLT